MTLSFTAMSGTWRRVSGAKVQQIILIKIPFSYNMGFLKKQFFSRVSPCMLQGKAL